jgi:ligand-binding SRPBCC domain-containing protein
VYFEFSSVIPAPVEKVFAFHERADVLTLLTPPWQKMDIVRREGGLRKGAVVEFLIHAGPFRVRWLAEHTEYEKNRLFADIQVKGPFRSWRHRHLFEPETTGTRLTDSIDLSLPGGKLLDWTMGWAVRWQLRRMFAYRHEVTRAGANEQIQR